MPGASADAPPEPPAVARARRITQALYRRLHATQVGPLARWARAQRLDRRLAPRTVFYPFGGPDVAFPVALFPSAREYVLVGLEPVLDGSGRDPLRRADAAVLVRELPVALGDLSGKGFFVTEKMRRDREAGRFPGVLALALATLGAAHADVLAIDYVCVDATAAISVVDRGAIARDPERRCGARVRFRMPDSAADKTLLYLSLSLGDRSLAAHPALEALLGTRSYVVFCKAAQYFMHGAHGPGFETVSRLSAGGAAILQDDTCLPLRAFDRAEWELAFFGVYQPSREYRHMVQPALQAVYRDRKHVRPLPQVAGYGRHTNMMLAVRRASRASRR